VEPTRVVAIGASAGGLVSLEQLFALLPQTTGMAFVVIQHLSPDYPSLMDELLGRVTQMKVTMAVDGEELEANHVYLLPPAKQMVVHGGRLILTERVAHTFTLPIDTFFRALAHDAGERAVAVVLSGSGTDGSRGIIDVKQAGGIVMVESLDTATFDGMPVAANATGVVDHVLAPREIAKALATLATQDPSMPEPTTVEASPTVAILDLLEQHYGIDFSLYKMTTVARRIQRRIALARLSTIGEYLDRLKTHRDEIDALYHDLLIGVTQFFRDHEAFDALAEIVIPKLLDMVPPEEELRVWIAACATGEEAYAITMLLWEAFEERKRPKHMKVLATDVHEGSLAVAAAGYYSAESLASVTPERMSRFFTMRGNGYQVSRDLRQHVVFARHDVTRDAPFTRMHLISCRNMLIYLEPTAYRSVIAMYHFGLAPNGFLFLGASESVSNLAEEFTTIDERWRIFQKRRDVQLVTDMKWSTPRRRRVAPLAEVTQERPLLDTYDQLLDMFMPPGFLVEEDYTLVDSFAGAEKLLHERARRPSRNVLDLLGDELRVVVAAAVKRALEENAHVTFAKVHVDLDGPVRCTINAKPLAQVSTAARRFVVVTLTAMVREVDAPKDPTPYTLQHAERSRIDSLETDLATARDMLHTSDAQLRHSHEDLQAANEELISMNEELQSTNEELQSLNEELYTVNNENQRQISELREMTADITHLLEDTAIGTLFLDRELRIRRFTSRIARVFRFRTSDIGRSIMDFATTLQRPELYDEIKSVRETGIAVTHDIVDADGTPYQMRIVRSRESSGVIFSLTEKRAAADSATAPSA
jgi:two-component system CheB/CheR fusion protein